jgi:hypothetical protein
MSQTPEEQKAEEVSYLSMSDEEAMESIARGDDAAPVVTPAPAADPEGEGSNDDDSGVAPTGGVAEGQDADPELEESDPSASGTADKLIPKDPEDGEDPEGEESKKADPVKPKEGEADPAKAKEDKPKAEDKPLEGELLAEDYKAGYEQIMAPFQANGKQMRANSIAEAIQLMQMGANYNKKMAGLKPSFGILKLLEKNGLMDESKLSFLIDIDKKNPEAIAKLIKDSGVDPLGIDLEKESSYKPGEHKVDQREVELDSVIDSISETPTYNALMKVVGDQWDDKSRSAVADSPQLLKVINDHMASGVYDIISQEVERERTFGRLSGLSDIDAYRQVGDSIESRKGFDQLFPAKEQRQQPPIEKKLVTPQQKPVDQGRNDKRREAAAPKPSASAVAKQGDANPLAQSDEDFIKSLNKN